MVAFNHNPLVSISDRIGILDVVVKSAAIKVDTYTPPKVDGLRRLTKTRTEKKVTIEFDIFTMDQLERQQILDAVYAWADTYDDKWLELENYEGKHLIATCTSNPDMDSVKDPTKSFKVEFTAFDPYWYQNVPTKQICTILLSSIYHTTMVVPGSGRECYLTFTVKNISTEPITAIMVKAGDSRIDLARNLSLAPGATIELGYSERGLQYIQIGTISAMDTRTDESDDDLILTQRAVNSINIGVGFAPDTILPAGSQVATCTLTARGSSL